MLRITPCGSAERAKNYFREALSRGEYYTEAKSLGQEIVGRWGGEAAVKLGLAGEVTMDAFDALCDNLSPVTGERLDVRPAGGLDDPNRLSSTTPPIARPKSLPDRICDSVFRWLRGTTRLVAGRTPAP